MLLLPYLYCRQDPTRGKEGGPGMEEKGLILDTTALAVDVVAVGQAVVDCWYHHYKHYQQNLYSHMMMGAV